MKRGQTWSDHRRREDEREARWPGMARWEPRGRRLPWRRGVEWQQRVSTFLRTEQRPSSTGSQGPTPVSATNSKSSPLPTPSLPHVPQGAPAGKVIHPQPRSAVDGISNNAKKDNSSKPAWSQSRPAGAPLGKADPVQDDFPTAAESAQGQLI